VASRFDRILGRSSARIVPHAAPVVLEIPTGGFERKDAATRRASGGRGFTYQGEPYTPIGADVDRMVKDGYERVIWVFKSVDAIAEKLSQWTIESTEGRGENLKVVDDALLPLLNDYSNGIERAAKYFKYRAVSQLLLSKKGVFVEAIPTNGGELAALNLLPPAYTRVIPDPDTFIKGFRVEIPGTDRHYDLPPYDHEKRSGVLWIRKPHPTDPYSSITPLEAAGISIDLDFYARLYNRNFLLNDGRAGQIVAVKGGLSPEDARELKARFTPGMAGAGRTTVIEADTVSVSDTATTPRDAQYAELRKLGKEDMLVAMGSPESVLGNASGRTFDNADAEKENWLDVTVLPLGGVFLAGFDGATEGGYDDDRRLRYDTSDEPVLRRRLEMKIEQARKDVAAGLITPDEFRIVAELDPMNRPGSRVLWLPGGKVAVGAEEDEKAASELKQVGAAPTGEAGGPPMTEGQAAQDLFGFDAQVDALSSPQGEPQALTAASADLDLESKALAFHTEDGAPFLEVKAFNPKQPRYPMNHPQGGQFMDTGDVARWLAGKPLKNGLPSTNVADPNAGSTASPSLAAGGQGGAARFLQHPDPKVRAAAEIVSFPSGYKHPRVLGAPPAKDLASAKATKLVSLRKGDVVQYSGPAAPGMQGPWAVAAAKRATGGQVELELVNDDGDVITVKAGAQQTLYAIARTPHPTVVAQAKRDVAAAARAMAGGPAPVPAPAAPAPAAAPAQTGTPLPTAPGWYTGGSGGLMLEVLPSGDVWIRSSSGTGGRQLVPGSARYQAAMNRQWSPTAAPTAAAALKITAADLTPGATFERSDGAELTVLPSGDVQFTPYRGTPTTVSASRAQLMVNAPVSHTWTQTAKGSGVAPTPAPTPAPAAPAAPAAPTGNGLAAPTAGGWTFAGQIVPGAGFRHPATGAGIVIQPDGSALETSASGGTPKRMAPSTVKKALGAGTGYRLMTTPQVPQYQLPPAPAGATVYAHPDGKHIYVLPGGGMEVWKPDGTRATTSATPQKLAWGHGKWQQVGAPASGPRPMTPAQQSALATLQQQAGAAPAPAPAAPAPAPAAAPQTRLGAVAAGAAAAANAPNNPPGTAPAATPPTATPPPAPAPVVTIPTTLRATGWTVTGGKQGSNAAAMMTAPNGDRYYVKSQAEEVADNEVTAGMLYKAAGVGVPDVSPISLLGGTFPGQTHTTGIASKVVDGSPTLNARMGRNAAFRDRVHEDFAVHAWLANWDAMENNNTIVDAAGRPVTIDVGGALRFRAQGGKRKLSHTVAELTSMRSSTNTGSGARQAFAGVTPNATDARFVRGVERIAAISPAQIRQLVDGGNPNVSKKDRDELVDALVARRAHLAREAGVTLPENRAGAPAAPAPATPAAPVPNTAGQVQATPTAPASALLGNQTPQSILTPPANYPYPIVANAPVATALKAPKSIKVASLRKGDVVDLNGTPHTVVSVDRKTGAVTVQGPAVGGVNPVTTVTPSSGSMTSVARTPHPQVVAAARRQLAGGGAPAPAPAQAPAPARAARQAAPAAPAAAPAPTVPAPAAPAAGAAPVFAPKTGVDVSTLGTSASFLQPGQTFTQPKTGNTFVVKPDGSVDWTAGPGSRATTTRSRTYTPAQAQRAWQQMAKNGYTATSGPDIDAPGKLHDAEVRKAARNVPLPPPGTPIAGTPPKGAVYPTAAAGPTSKVRARDLQRGQTLRIGGEDWIVTEAHPGREVWGYRPGKDDPNTLTQDAATKKWRQGVRIQLPARGDLDVVGPAPVPAVSVPQQGKARPHDPALGAVQSITVGTGHGAGLGFSVNTQVVKADTLKAGDVIVLNGRESEGTFVVTAVGTDAKGRQNVQGFAGTTADLTGAPRVGTHLFLTNPNGSAMREVRVQVDGATPALPNVPHPSPPRGPTSIVRHDISDAASQAKLMSIINSPPPRLSSNGINITDVGDRILGHLWELRGYNEFPDVVSESDMDAHVADGEIELWRGMDQVRARGNTQDVAEDYRSGDHFPGGGACMYGAGTYAAYGSGVQAGTQGTGNAITFTQGSYARGGGGVQIRMTMKADARIVDHDAIQRAYQSDQTPVAKALRAKFGMHSSNALGHYAVILGYDAIRKTHPYGHGTTKSDDWGHGFMVILNRSAMRVSEKNYVQAAQVRSAPAAAPPPLTFNDARHRMNSRTAKHANGVDYRVKGEP